MPEANQFILQFSHAYSHAMDPQGQTIKRYAGIGGIEWHRIIRRGVSRKDSVDQMKQAATHSGSISAKQPMCANSNPTFKGQRHSWQATKQKAQPGSYSDGQRQD
jgi:hypothetical protein